MADNEVSQELIDQRAVLGHLASGVGHHVINAFSAVVSNAEILRLSTQSGQPIDPAVIADLIVRTAMEASAVARRLIDFTRPMTLPGPERVQLDALVGALVDEVRVLHGQGIRWQADLAPVPSIPGNESHLRAMLLLLLNNAVEALPGGSGSIGVSTSLDVRGWIALELRDDGQGMLPEVQERAVEPFFSTKPGRPGVGLSIANGIWRRHRGTLAIQSQAGRGTSIRLCIHPGPEPSGLLAAPGVGVPGA